MAYGNARVTVFDAKGCWFVDDIGVGDLWHFPPGSPHSIQGIGPDVCEFLLAFDDGGFDEDSTLLLYDWLKHIPPEILAKNFLVPVQLFPNRLLPRMNIFSPARCLAAWPQTVLSARINQRFISSTICSLRTS